MPSITYKGWLEPLKLEVPRMLIDTAAPGSPLESTFKPEIPFKIDSATATPALLSILGFTVVIAAVTSDFVELPYPIITISSIVLSLFLKWQQLYFG